MPGPKITIIVASYNAGKTLERCIQSVLTQSYSNREIIVIDGASKDNSLSVIQKFQNQLAYWVSEPDRGIYDAWNKALKKMTGDWICFLGADDQFYDTHVLQSIAHELDSARPTYKVVYGKVAVVSESGEILEIVGKPWNEASKLIRHELSIPHQGTFQHRTLFEQKGHFDASFKITGDYDLLLRELKDRPAFFLSDPIITRMQIGGVSSLLENVQTNLSELRRARKNSGLPDFSLPLTWRETRAKARRILRTAIGKKGSDRIADLYRVMTGKSKIWTDPK